MPDVYVAAGSNVEPLRNLSTALASLAKLYGPLRVSPAYRNRAVGFEGDDFVNLVLGFGTDETVHQVRERLQGIETECGRPRDAAKWAPRSMDLDILLYGDRVSSEPGLVLPRPDLTRRSYMLKPMADIAPDVAHPILGKTMRGLWDAFEDKAHEMREVELLEATRR